MLKPFDHNTARHPHAAFDLQLPYCMTFPPEMAHWPEEVKEGLDYQGHLDRVMTPIRGHFQDWLDTLSGKNLEDYDHHRRLAFLVQHIADQLRLLFKCNKCGALSRFRCVPNGRMPHGSFIFSHDKKTHGGTSAIPKLTIALSPVAPADYPEIQELFDLKKNPTDRKKPS